MNDSGLNNEQGISRHLLEQIAEGDEHSFAILYRNFYGELQPIRWRCAASGLDPSEILQLTFMKLWLNRERLVLIGNLKSWIIKVAYREYLMALRKKLSYDEKLENLSAEKKDDNVAVTPFQILNHQELKKLIQKVVRSLPPQRKAVYTLSREEGLKIDEIAQRLSISPNTVKSVLQTVLRLIREKLTEAGYGPFLFIIFMQFFDIR